MFNDLISGIPYQNYILTKYKKQYCCLYQNEQLFISSNIHDFDCFQTLNEEDLQQLSHCLLLDLSEEPNYDQYSLFYP